MQNKTEKTFSLQGVCDYSKTTGATGATRAYKATCAKRADICNTCFQFPWLWKKNIPHQDTLKKLNVRQQQQKKPRGVTRAKWAKGALGATGLKVKFISQQCLPWLWMNVIEMTIRIATHRFHFKGCYKKLNVRRQQQQRRRQQQQSRS